MPDDPEPQRPATAERFKRFGRLNRFGQSTLGLGLAGSLLMWLAQPPAMLGLLAWLAPAPWLLLIVRDELRGWRAWLAVWFAGFVYWAAAVWWVALPHPLTPIGLPFLAGYLGCYPLAFVALARVGCHRAGMPLWLAAPVVWVGLEWIQSHLFSGFLMAALSHTQAWRPEVIQIAALGGAYAVSFVMMMFTAGVVDGVLDWRRRRSGEIVAIDNRPPAGFFAAALPVAMTLFYGHHALQDANERYTPGPTIALIQGDTRATWDPDPDRSTRIMERQTELSFKALEMADAEGKRVDLLVWPESMFRLQMVTYAGAIDPPPEVTPEDAQRVSAAHTRFQSLARMTGTPMLVGIDRFDLQPPFEGDPVEWKFNIQNSAAFADAQGRVTAIYDKMHRVPFGEYIPLFDNVPALYFLTPLPGGVTPGEAPVGMTLEGPGARGQGLGAGGQGPATKGQGPGESYILSPNICYETVIPHVIRNQVRTLSDDGSPADVMVNVTNNAWFWGSSELEMHLACNVFRAVENRTPMVIAANGGLSAAIDSAGRLLAVSDRMTEQALLADVPLDPEPSPYTNHGDVLAWACLIVCGLLVIIRITKAEGALGGMSSRQLGHVGEQERNN